MKQVVCREHEMKPGEMRVVYIQNKKPVIVTCNSNREYFALLDSCPHQGARLSQGTLTWKTVSEEPCSYGIEKEGEILRCPWHSFDFDVRTGSCLGDPDHLRTKIYRVSIEDGNIVLEV